MLNAPGSAVLPLLARTLVPKPKGPISVGWHDDVHAQGTRDRARVEIALQGDDLVAFDASEIGSCEIH